MVEVVKEKHQAISDALENKLGKDFELKGLEKLVWLTYEFIHSKQFNYKEKQKKWKQKIKLNC